MDNKLLLFSTAKT